MGLLAPHISLHPDNDPYASKTYSGGDHGCAPGGPSLEITRVTNLSAQGARSSRRAGPSRLVCTTRRA